jgi:transposase
MNSVEKIAYLEKLLEQKNEENKRLKQEVDLLTQKVDLLLQKIFGRKSETIDPGQLLFALNGDETIVEEEESDDDLPPEPPKPKRKRKPAKERLPDDLPEVREYVEDPEEVKANPEAYDCIEEIETVKLEVSPTRFYKRILVRKKFIRKDHTAAPVMASSPVQFIYKSIASETLVAYIMILKFVDHLPFYRIEQILARQGIDISRKRMGEWLAFAAEWLQPIYDSLKDIVRTNDYLQVDETPVGYIDPGKGRTSKGYLWAYNVPYGAIVYDWHPSRASDCLHDMLDDYNGLIQTDGYAAYDTYNKYRETSGLKSLEQAACLAHARRKFFEAQKESDLAKRILMKINLIYRIERNMRENGITGEERQKVRTEKVKPVFNEIKKLLDSSIDRHLPQSNTGRAIRYALKLWDKLSVFIENGDIEPDNNLVENSIRPTAIGKKNWLFFGSETSGQNSAIIYTVVENCKRLGINPYDYLVDVFKRIPSMINQSKESLLPANWLAERQKKAA